ncbi:hypothetical protein BH09BAC5_BH09BAC5_17760 [soil metagenome]
MGGYNWTISNRNFWDVTGPKIALGVNFSGQFKD